jgi:hypothetical protein
MDIWIIVLLILLPTAAACWLARETSRLRARLKRLSRTAQSKHKYYQDLESHHEGEADLKERTAERLRSYLQLMDTLINTIPNPIFSKMSTASSGAATRRLPGILSGSRGIASSVAPPKI